MNELFKQLDISDIREMLRKQEVLRAQRLIEERIEKAKQQQQQKQNSNSSSNAADCRRPRCVRVASFCQSSSANVCTSLSSNVLSGQMSVPAGRCSVVTS